MLVAALVQISFVTPISIAGGHADLLLVMLVSLALLRGPMLGAVGGFWAGFVLDIGTMQPLGLSSLVLTLAGYWTGRFGEATTRNSPHPPLIAVALATVWVAVGSAIFNFMLGQSVPAGELFGHVLLADAGAERAHRLSGLQARRAHLQDGRARPKGAGNCLARIFPAFSRATPASRSPTA